MTAIDFPNDPDIGEIYIVSGKAWRWTGSVWDLVGAISEGPQGPTGPASTELGPTGPTGATGFTGSTGPTGPQGSNAGITVLGSVANIAALPSTGNSGGDAYQVESEGEIYVWDVADSEWFSVGALQGPTGPTGPLGLRGNDSTVPGPTGPSGPTGGTGPAGAGYDGITIAIDNFSGGTLTGELNKLGAITVGATVRVISNANPLIFADGQIFSITGLDVSITISDDLTGGTLASLTNPKVSLSGLKGIQGADGVYEVSATAPSSPVEGDTWFDSVNGKFYVYYDSYWVEISANKAGPTGPTGPTGLTGPPGIVSVTGPITNSGTSTEAIIGLGTPDEATIATAANGFGYMGIPQSTDATTTGNYTITAADAGEHIYASATRTITIPANSSVELPVGTTIILIAGAGATMTIAINTDTLLIAGSGVGGAGTSRTLAAHSIATIIKATSTLWYISGNGLS